MRFGLLLNAGLVGMLLVGAVEVSGRLVLIVLIDVSGGVGAGIRSCASAPATAVFACGGAPSKKLAVSCGRLLYMLCNFLKCQHYISFFFEDFSECWAKEFCFGIG